jgi:oxygen-independent coproporphyrinogen III oxidase
MAINVYIHLPFCHSKCRYCAFYSLPGTSHPIPEYVDVLKQEMKQRLGKYKEHVSSIYFGGGTPSLLSAKQIGELVDTLRHYLTFSQTIEITMEANPESLITKDVNAYQEAGINRLNIGLQAWQQSWLTYMGRTHSAADFVAVFKQARAAGFTNIGVDVIFGFRGQTMADWTESLTQVVQLQPDHIACYSLEVDPLSAWGKLYAQGIEVRTQDSTDRQMYRLAESRLAAANYRHYELSNWAMKNKECRHNMDFWRSCPYLGFGAGASSWHKQEAWRNRADLKGYLTSPTSVLEREVAGNLRLRWLLLRLRLVEGF